MSSPFTISSPPFLVLRFNSLIFYFILRIFDFASIILSLISILGFEIDEFAKFDRF